jgi:hypothetical protein
MGQPNLERIAFRPQELITSLTDDVRHLLGFTGYYRVGDTVDIYDLDANGCCISILGTRTIVAIEKDVALIFDSTIDTSAATGTPYAFTRNIDDGQEAIDRLYRYGNQLICEQNVPIVAQALNVPGAGKTTSEVDDVSFLRAGDQIEVISDEGTAGTATIESIAVNADQDNNRSEVVIDTLIDTSALTSPRMKFDLSICSGLNRLKDDIDAIDLPIENEDLDVGDCSLTAFETDNLFVQGSSKVFLDGVRKKLGSVGSRASHAQGIGDSALLYTRLILGLNGNKTKVAVVAGAGLTVAVTGSFTAGYTVSVNDNGGAATSAEIAAAIEADPIARRIVQVTYGGTGTGVVATFAATSLTGGADDGSGDYAELSQLFENKIVNTGFKWISFWIIPSDRNRMNAAPKCDEELVIDYRRPLRNV